MDELKKDHDLSELSDLLDNLGIVVEEPATQTPLQKTRVALRKYSANEIEKVYARTIKKVGKDLEFSSPRYLATAIIGLITDGMYTLWDPIQQILQSPIVSDMITKRVGEGKTLTDLIVSFGTEGKSEEEQMKTSQSIREGLKKFSRSEVYIQAITDRCSETGKSPDKILKSKKEMWGIMIKTYGSWEQYEKTQLEAIENVARLVKKIDALQKTHLELIVPALIAAKMGSKASKLGMNPSAIGRAVSEYVADAARFGKAFLIEYAKYAADNLAQYKKLAQSK